MSSCNWFLWMTINETKDFSMFMSSLGLKWHISDLNNLVESSETSVFKILLTTQWGISSARQGMTDEFTADPSFRPPQNLGLCCTVHWHFLMSHIQLCFN